MHLLYSIIFYYVFYFERFTKPFKYNQEIQNVTNLNAVILETNRQTKISNFYTILKRNVMT